MKTPRISTLAFAEDPAIRLYVNVPLSRYTELVEHVRARNTNMSAFLRDAGLAAMKAQQTQERENDRPIERGSFG